MCPPLVSSLFETALVLELCQPCFPFFSYFIHLLKHSTVFKNATCAYVLVCLFDGKMVWILNVILILIFL